MPSRDLKIALVPLDIVANRSEENLQNALRRLDALEPDTGLAVLPEMFNTGFTAVPDLLGANAQSNDGPVVTTLRRWALEHSTAVWGGFTAIDGGRFYNRGFMIDDYGEVQFYDKRHLFGYGGERELITPGHAIAPIIDYRSWRIKMAICYDIRFPVWNRSRANDYDLLVVPANWANARYFAWKHMLIARAIENQCFVAGCNREGADIYGEYRRGDSMVLNNWGDDISRRLPDGTVYATLGARQFDIDRQRFAPWRDADDFKLIID